jgi:hypothetical protein
MRRPLLTLPASHGGAGHCRDNISGKWSGSLDRETLDGNVDSTPVIAEFKPHGNTVKGTAGVPGFEPSPVAAVAGSPWSGGCGAVPASDSNQKLVGTVTDRDLCVALGTRDRR